MTALRWGATFLAVTIAATLLFGAVFGPTDNAAPYELAAVVLGLAAAGWQYHRARSTT